MKVRFDDKGDFRNAEEWLSKISKRDPTQALNQIAREGEKSLSLNTPKDTGETAAGWKSTVVKKKDSSEIAWSNVAHPESNVNVAVLIDKGHGTRTGGYVPPKPYIEKAMDSVWDSASERIVKELID